MPRFNSSKIESMQRPGTEAIGTQIQPSKTKREITKIYKEKCFLVNSGEKNK